MNSRFPHPMGTLTDPPPACWRWKPVTDVTIWGLLGPWTPEFWTRLDKRQQQCTIMYEWHRGRCAVCGRIDRVLVEDHSHQTGLTRGFLCKSCNVREGNRWGGAYENYRARNPASILCLWFPYIDPVTGLAARPARGATARLAEYIGKYGDGDQS